MKRTLAVLAALTALATAAACSSAHDIATSNSTGTAETSAVPTSTVDTPTPTPPPPSTTTSEPSRTTMTPSPTAEPTTTAPPVVRPTVGDCYDTGKRAFQAQRDPSSAVKCSGSHTAETFAVFAVGSKPGRSAVNQVWRTCEARFKNYVGESTTVSTLSFTVMLPGSPQGSDSTATWARCDALEQANYNGKGGLPRAGSVRDALRGGVPTEFRGCVRHWPKVDQPVHFTSCQQAHQAELIPESVNLGGPEAAFPGEAITKQRSQQFCEGVFQNYVPETLNYYYYWPTAVSWRSGTHDTACWALDTQGDGLPPI